jgi:ribonuclease P protein component
VPPVATDPARVAARPDLWRITDRRSFAALRSHGTRARHHGLSVTWAAPPAAGPATPARAGFAVARSAGGAVVRNRIRRRLRAALRQLAAEGRLPAGDYLVGAGADVARRPWAALVEDLGQAVATATAGSR